MPSKTLIGHSHDENHVSNTSLSCSTSSTVNSKLNLDLNLTKASLTFFDTTNLELSFFK